MAIRILHEALDEQRSDKNNRVEQKHATLGIQLLLAKFHPFIDIDSLQKNYDGDKSIAYVLFN